MKSLVKIGAAILVIAAVLLLFRSKPAANELNLLIWDNYLAPDTLANFEKATNSKVIVELFKSNEEALAKIKANPGTYDVVVPSDYMIDVMKTDGVLETLDHAKIPNIANIAASAKGNYFDPDFSVSVPYAVGSAGFAVNTKFVTEKTLSWQGLTDAKYKGHIVLMDDMRYVLGSVLLELGLDPNTRNKADIEKAVTLLKKVLPNVSKITPDTPVDLMVAEGAWIAYGYSGDSYQMHDGNPAITYMFPDSGGMEFFDNLAIPANPPHKELAEQFLNYILDPKVAADLVNATHYAHPIPSALQYVEKDVRENPSVFVSDADMKKLHFVMDLGDDVALYDNAWQEIKQ